MMAEFSVTPIGSGTSVREPVAKAVRIVRSSGLPHEVHAMGTVLEGSWDEVMNVIRTCHDELLKEHERLSISIKIDARRGAQRSMRDKVASVSGDG